MEVAPAQVGAAARGVVDRAVAICPDLARTVIVFAPNVGKKSHTWSGSVVLTEPALSVERK